MKTRALDSRLVANLLRLFLIDRIPGFGLGSLPQHSDPVELVAKALIGFYYRTGDGKRVILQLKDSRSKRSRLLVED